MAIAFQAADSNITDFSTVSSVTYSFANAGDALAVMFLSNGTTDPVSGVTFNGDSLTRTVTKETSEGGSFRAYMYHMVAPDVTTANVVISASGQLFLNLTTAQSYTGAAQTGQPDSIGSTTNDASTSVVTSCTVVAANSWMVSFAYNNASDCAASTGVTSRATASYSGDSVAYGRSGDSNGPLSAGANSQTYTFSSSKNVMVAATFAPDLGGGGVIRDARMLSLIGVG